MSILPIVIGAITIGAIAVLNQQPQVANHVANSEDALVALNNYQRDVQSASQITTSSSIQACGSGGTQLLGIQSANPMGTPTYVAYAEVTRGSGTGTTYALVRRYCVGNTTNVTSNQEVATNLPAPSAQNAATVTCASTVTCNASSGWVSTAGISSVSLAIYAPGPIGAGPTSTNGKYLYSLNAIPQSWSPTSGGSFAGGAAITPFMVLGSSSPCPSPPSAQVTMSGNPRVISGGGSAPIAVVSNCAGTVSLAGSSEIQGSKIETQNCNLNSVTLSGTSSAPPQVCATVTNPFLALQPPSNPTTSLTGSCPGNPVNGTCTPGLYASSPTLGSNARATFGTGAAGSVFIFNNAVSITNNAQVTFGSGTYWFKGGLSVSGAATVTFDSGTYIFGTNSTSPVSTNTIAITNGATVQTGPGGALLYVEGGSADFSGGSGTSLLGQSANFGIAVWDGVNNPASIVNISNGASTAAAYGGIYVQYGQLTDTGAGTVNASFVVTNTATINNSGTLNLG